MGKIDWHTMKEIYARMFAGKSAAWTAVFTCVLMVFSGLLLQVSKDSNESSIAQGRAFLNVISGPQMQNVIGEKRITGYTVHEAWINSRTTPTQTAVAQFNVANWQERPQHGFDFDRLPQAERQEYVLGPKAAWEVIPVPVSFDDINASMTGRHIFAWGWVVYRDIFKRTPPRLSEFCFELINPRWSGPDHTNPSVAITLDAPPCQTHNCYDEHCEDYAERVREAK